MVRKLPLADDDRVADVGAGTGYFSFRIAPAVPRGEVLAVDIQPEMFAIIEERGREEGVDNVRGVRGSVTDPNLPEAAVDLALIVDACHEFSHPREMAAGLLHEVEAAGFEFLRNEDFLPQQHFLVFRRPR
ncbi:class I SAM-dependent methyltransferase [Lentisalinibacter salinarum]